METIDVTPIIAQFEEHLKENGRTIFSAHFGDGKTWFLNKFIESKTDRYEFIVLYPVNYQIAPNEAVMEYIKRDILFQLIIKGKLTPGVKIPDSVLFQWYISQKSGSLFNDVLRVISSLQMVDSKWQVAVATLLAISKEITDKINSFGHFKREIESEDDFNKAAGIIKTLSCGAGNIYELDMVSYLIIETLNKIKTEEHKTTVLLIEDMDRIDPAHLFRILNVFSAHIDRIYQCSEFVVKDEEGIDVPIDTFKNKFGFDKVIMVLDNDTTQHIFSHFYGEQANYLGYISKFIEHNVFYYSIAKYSTQLLVQHLSNKCCVRIEQIVRQDEYGLWYVEQDDLTVRKIAQVLDNFDNSIVKTQEVINGTQTCFDVSNKLTRTISTLRRLGMTDDRIFFLLKNNLSQIELLEAFGGFLMKQANSAQSFSVYYESKVFTFHVDHQEGGLVRFGKCFDRELRTTDDYKFLSIDIYEAYNRACQYVK